MKLQNNDKVLIFFIKYAPILFVTLLSLFTTEIVLLQKEENYKKEVREIENNYYQTNKDRIKEEVDNVFSYISKQKASTEDKLKQSIKQRVEEAYAIANNIYNNEIKRHTKEEVFEIIKNTLGSILFNNGRGYYFMLNKEGISLLQPLNTQFEGHDFTLYEDKNGYRFIDKVKNTIANKTQTFDNYFWYKNKDTKKTYKKISFYKYFEPFDMVIGTGEYIDSFEEELKKRLLNEINKIRYADDNYIFVLDYEGTYLAHYQKDLIGVNRYDFKNPVGQYLARDIINQANKDGIYMSYIDTINPEKFIENNTKTSYIKKFDNWQWIIGTGFYTQKLNSIIEKKKERLKKEKDLSVKNIIIISIFITAMLLIISFFISKILERRLNSYREKIKKQIIDNREKDNIMFQQSKMATMGEMIANIAHQWRQPLSQISTISSGVKMQEELGILNKEALTDNMNSISRSVQYLSQTIDDFRNFFSPSKNYQEFDISDTIDKTLNLVKSQFDSNDIEIIKDVNSYKLNTLENEISQVLINLLKNAKDALIENNEINRRFIFIKTYEDEKYIYLSILDNARGIPKKNIEKIFEPYFTTKGNEGTGIGLFMSKNILEKNIYGKLEVENIKYEYEGEKQKGALFTMSIPKE